MIRTSRRAFAVPAILALTAGALTAPALADPRGPLVRAGGSLSDLQAAAGPFDGAHAVVQIVASAGGSHTVLRVRGIHGADGQTFGAHLHAGPCVAGDGAAALGHYNTDVIAGDPTPEISEDTEVWLDFTVDDGAGTATASVPFIRSRETARSSSTPWRPTTTRGSQAPVSRASRSSGDPASGHCRGPRASSGASWPGGSCG